jgi:hypothetical protein
MTYDEVTTFISREADAKQLAELRDLVDRSVKARNSSLPLGTRVRLVNIRPKYLEGVTGVTVRSLKAGKIAVTLDEKVDRYSETLHLAPQCVEAL